MKYDDQKWHLNDDYPEGLDEKYAMTHMGFFLTWIIDNELESELLKTHFYNEIQLLKERKINGVDFIILCCDNKLSSDDFNPIGNLFSEYYYASDKYFDDYVDLSSDNNNSVFEEPNTWEKYNLIRDRISNRYNKWIKKKR